MLQILFKSYEEKVKHYLLIWDTSYYRNVSILGKIIGVVSPWIDVWIFGLKKST